MTHEGRRMIPRHRCREPLDQGQLPIAKICLESIYYEYIESPFKYILHQINAMQINFTIFSDRLEYSLEDIIIDNYV